MKKRARMILAGVGLLALSLAACQPSTGGTGGTSATQALPVTGETAAPAVTAAVTQPPEVTEMAATTAAPTLTQAIATTAAPATTEAPAATEAATTAPGASAAACNLTQEQEQQLVSAGETLYTATCVACHGAEGKGQGNFPALSSNPDVTAEDPEAMLAVLLNPQIHPFVNQLDSEQIASVVSYIRSAFGNQASTICAELIPTAAP
jgi:mono/diheme cytochrome c family protein